jgi:hypothetical protein
MGVFSAGWRVGKRSWASEIEKVGQERGKKAPSRGRCEENADKKGSL